MSLVSSPKSAPCTQSSFLEKLSDGRCEMTRKATARRADHRNSCSLAGPANIHRSISEVSLRCFFFLSQAVSGKRALWCRLSLTQRAVQSASVLEHAPLLDQDLCLSRGVEDLTVQVLSLTGGPLVVTRALAGHRRAFSEVTLVGIWGVLQEPRADERVHVNRTTNRTRTSESVTFAPPQKSWITHLKNRIYSGSRYSSALVLSADRLKFKRHLVLGYPQRLEKVECAYGSPSHSRGYSRRRAAVRTGIRGTESASAPSKTTQTTMASQRGGSITVGDDSWTVVPSTQCSIYPGNVVSIAGHTAEDPTLEIVIDYGGPNQIRIGGEFDGLWHAMHDTIKVEIAGKRIRGTATFNESLAGTGKSAEGSFEVNCG